MDNNSDMETKIDVSIFNADKDILRWQKIEMHYIIHDVEPWILCICKADTSNADLHNIVQYPQ